MGQGEGFAVDHDEVARCATRLSTLQEDARRIAAAARDADPDALTLGALGEIVWQLCRDTSQQLHEHLDLLQDSLGRYAVALDCTATTYRDVEDQHVRDLDRLAADLGEPS